MASSIHSGIAAAPSQDSHIQSHTQTHRRPSLPPMHPTKKGFSPSFSLRSVGQQIRNGITSFRSEYNEGGVIGKEAALFAGYIVAGINDAAPGAVLPSIQEHYNISYVVVSMIFICNLAGWLIAAGLCPWFTDKFGFGKALSFFAILAVIPYTVFIPLPPFGVFAVVFVLSGLSVGSQDSLANTWMSSRPRADLRLGVLHFVYGLGALLAPLSAAPFNEASFSFSYFYAIPLGLAVFNFAMVTGAWRWKREVEHPSDHGIVDVDHTEIRRRTSEEEAIELATVTATLPQVGGATAAHSEGPSTPAYELKTPFSTAETPEDIRASGGGARPLTHAPSSSAGAQPPAFTGMTTKQKYKAVFRNRQSYILAFFALFYVGCEVACGGWSSSFLLSKESPNLSIADANHLISGFWGGIAAGRVLLIPLTTYIGAQMAVFLYLGLAIGLQLVVWLAPHVIADGLGLAFMGLFLGPLFPIMIEIASVKIRPKALHTTAIAFIVSFGSAGSALFPFIVGLIAQARGIQVLPPILVALLVAQAIIWACLGDPRKKKQNNVEDRVD